MLKKVIWISASLIVTVSLIFKLSNAAHLFSRWYDTQIEAESVRIDEMEKYPIVRYDNRDIDGAKVISYVKEISGKTTVIVKTDKKTFVADTTQYTKYTDVSSDYYIAPTKMYAVRCTENGNSVITTVTITVK